MGPVDLVNADFIQPLQNSGMVAQGSAQPVPCSATASRVTNASFLRRPHAMFGNLSYLPKVPPLTFRRSRLSSGYGWFIPISRPFAQNSFVRTPARSWARGYEVLRLD